MSTQTPDTHAYREHTGNCDLIEIDGDWGPAFMSFRHASRVRILMACGMWLAMISRLPVEILIEQMDADETI